MRAWWTQLAVVVSLFGCTTLHPLGRIDDPRARAEVDRVAATGDALLHLRQPIDARKPPLGYRVSGVMPSGFVIEPSGGRPLLVAPVQVASLSRYDRRRGAREGALMGGLGGFAIGLGLGILVTTARPGCSDDCGPAPDAGVVGLTAGALFGLVGAALGTGLGAAVGHEDRYSVGPP